MKNNNSINLTIENDLSELIAAIVIEVITYYQIQTNEKQVNELNNIIINSKRVQNAMTNTFTFKRN